MIAMVQMCDPELLIADEPTTALDVTVQAQILRLLQKVQQEMGLALLLITHDFGIVARMAQHVSVMYAGEVVETGPVERDLRCAHASLHTRSSGLHSGAWHDKGRRAAGGYSRRGTSHLAGISGCGFRDRCARATVECGQTVPSARCRRRSSLSMPVAAEL